MSLFRSEALAAHSSRHTEGIVTTRPRLVAAATTVAVILGTAVVAFGYFGSYSARVSAIGSLRTDLGLIAIAAASSGTVQSIAVNEGDEVGAGDILAELQSSRSDASGAALTEEIAQRIDARKQSLESSASAQFHLLDERDLGLRAQIAAARDERERMRAELLTRERQAALSNEALVRGRDIHRKGYLSDTQLHQMEAEALQREGSVQSLQRELASSERSMAQLQQALAEIPKQRESQHAQLDRDLAALDQERLENAARGETSVKASVAGRITTRIVEPGQTVQAGQPLFAILPDGAQLQAHLLVPSRAVGFVEEGDTVRLRYQAFPYQKFGHQRGTVLRISRSALGPAEQSVLLGQAQTSEPLYRVVVALERPTVTAYGLEQPLLPGMAVEADVLLEERRMIEWIFEPLYSLRGRLTD